MHTPLKLLRIGIYTFLYVELPVSLVVFFGSFWLSGPGMREVEGIGKKVRELYWINTKYLLINNTRRSYEPRKEIEVLLYVYPWTDGVNERHNRVKSRPVQLWVIKKLSWLSQRWAAGGAVLNFKLFSYHLQCRCGSEESSRQVYGNIVYSISVSDPVNWEMYSKIQC